MKLPVEFLFREQYSPVLVAKNKVSKKLRFSSRRTENTYIYSVCKRNSATPSALKSRARENQWLLATSNDWNL
jgi:hypothetical protein